MNAKFADHRLAAYLDNALSTEEAAEIRQQVSRDHELRCLLDDLRQARGEVQALPRLRVSEGFAERVLAQIAQNKVEISANKQPSGPHTNTQPARKPLSSWQSFVLGVTAASVVGLLVWAGFLQNATVPQVADGSGGTATIEPLVAPPQASPEDRKLTIAQLGTALQQSDLPGQVYLLRVTVNNKLLLSGEFDQQLAQHGLTVRGSMSDLPALRSATEAIEKLEPITAQTMRLPVDEVFVLDGSAEQLAAALPVWTEQPADVASASDEVLALSPTDKHLVPDPALDKVAVRIGRKQLYRAMGIDLATGESSPNPEGSSEVLVVIRVK